LKPRSVGAADASTVEHKSGKSNPFGAAKPRELVLASKGIDPSTIDAKVAKKSVVKHYTKVRWFDMFIRYVMLWGPEKNRWKMPPTPFQAPSHLLTYLFPPIHPPFRRTQEQEREIEAVRSELTKYEAELREANEMELPEETYRLKAEEKRKELSALMAKFAKENEEQQPAASEMKFERPSERRKRLEQQGGRDGDSYSTYGHRDEGGF
jgi:hypothetical protein